MSYKIYLCGGMTGLSDEEQKNWRISVKHELNQYIRQGEVLYFDPTEYYIEPSPNDEDISMKFDLRNLIESNLVVCNISSNPFSVGTNIELGVAHNVGIPVITYNPKNIEMHPWQKNISDFEIDDIERLVEIIRDYYLPR